MINNIISQQMDTVFFIYGLCYFALFYVGVSLRRLAPNIAPWKFLYLSAIVHALYEWWYLIPFFDEKKNILLFPHAVLLMASFICLIEFSRRILSLYVNKQTVWAVAFFAVISGLFGICNGYDGLIGSIGCFLGGLGALGASFAFYLLSKKEPLPRGKRILITAFSLFFVYAVTYAAVPDRHFSAVSFRLGQNEFNIIRLCAVIVRGVITAALAITLWRYFLCIKHTGIRLECSARQKRGTHVFLWVFVVIVLGGLLSAIGGSYARSLEKKYLLGLTNGIASQTDMKMVASLKGGPSDLGTPEYKSLTEQFVRYGDSIWDIRYIYVLEEKDDKIYFCLDSEPNRYKSISRECGIQPAVPGGIYRDVPPEIKNVFRTGKDSMVGPYSDRWGTFVTGAVVIKGSDGRLVRVLALDVDASHWRVMIALHRMLPLLIALLVIFLIATYFLESERIKDDEITIHENENRFRSLVKNIPGAIYRCTYDGTWTMHFMSDAIFEITGYPASDFISNSSRTYLSIIHPDDMKMIEGLLPEGKDSFSVEYRIIRSDGAIRWVYGRGAGIRGVDGQKAYIDGVVFDVTERRNTEEKIRESEKTMNVALSASPVGICRLNNRVLEWGNKTFFNMFGYDLEELSQHSIRILYNNDVECERVGKILYTYGFCESKMRTKSGKIIEVGMRSANISGNTYIVTFMDLTQLKKREHEVVLARKRYEELINNLPICIYRNTPGSAGSFIEANPAIVELLEAGTKENLLTKNVSDFYANQSDRIGVSEKIMKQGYVKDEKVQLKTMTGKVFTASITAILKKDQDDRTYFDGAITDVTEKEEAQRLLRLAYDSLKAKETELQSTIQKLEQMNQDLRDAEKKVVQSEKLASIGELSAGIAHEINNPVGFISSNLVTLSGYIDDISKVMRAFESLEKAIDEKNYEKAQNVRAEILDLESSLDMKYVLSDLENLVRESTQGVDRIKHIVADLKTFSHKDDGIKAQCDLNKVMDAIINIVWNEIKYKAELKKDYGDIPMVECNMQQIGQVLMNLLINAAQAIEGKGVIYIRTYHADDFVFVEVSDTGKGIPQELRDKIFHPFFTTKEIGKGTGLGLSISMDIVKKHYGRIDVVSKEGKGAVFTVCLPVKSAAKRG